MSRLRRCAPVLAVAVALVAAGCGGDDGGGGGGGDTSKPIRIGASLPLTGEFSEPGKAAQQGYEVWEELTNDEGGLLGRKVEIIVRDDASDQNTVVADYNALISRDEGRPAARHVLVAAQHPGLDGGRAQPDALRRAGRRRAGDLRPRLQVPVLRPAGDGRQAGRSVRRVHPRPARRRAPEDRRVPDAGRPVRAAGARGHPREVRGGRHPDRLPERPTRRDTTNFDSIANARQGGRTPTSSCTARRSPTASASSARWTRSASSPSVLPDQRPVVRRPVLQGRRRGEHRGHVLRGEPHGRGRDAGQREFVRQVPASCSAPASRPRTPPTRSPRRRSSRRRSRPSARSSDQKKLADWLRANQVETILGALKWDERGRARRASS